MNRLLAAVAILGMSLSMGSVSAEPLKIGMITTLSGGGAGLGIGVRDGFMLAIEEAGNSDIKVVIEDDAMKPDLAVRIADKMIQSDKVDVLTGIIWSNLAMAVVPGAVNQGLFYVSPNAGPSALAGKLCHENYFNAAWQNDNLHEAMGKHASASGYRKVFALAPNYPAGTDALTGFKRFYEGELAAELYTKLGQSDYASEIAQIRASGADAVYYFLPGGMGIAFMKQYAQSGIDIPVLAPGFALDQDVLGALGDSALGVANTAQWSPDLDNEANRAFVEAFKAKYDRIPSIFAHQGYDAARLILSAAAKAPVTEKNAFRAALKEADFASTRGDFRFGSNNHPIQDVHVRKVVKTPEGELTNQTIGLAFADHQDAYVSECAMK